MALDADLQTFKSAVVSNDNTNGGVLSINQVISGVAQNVFPNVLKAERTAGSTKYRKLFNKLNDDSNDALSGVQLYLDLPTPADDWITMFIGTAIDTQADIVGTERKYGAAYIKNDVTAGLSTVTVTVDNVSLTTGNDKVFADGDSIRITDKENPDSVSGNEEFLVIDGEPTVSSNDVTITTLTPFANSYTVVNSSRVSSVYDAPGDILAEVGILDITSTAGTYDDTTYLLVPNNQGTIDTTITLEFTDAANFTATSPDITGLPAGSTSVDYAPVNSDWTKVYCTMLATGWGGTFIAGDTVEIPLTSATIPFWEKRVVPALAAPLSNNRTVSAWNGESA